MQGVICGAHASLEWLLEFWWVRYSSYNDFPVTFFDFGLSVEGRAWCEQRGAVIGIEIDQVTSKERCSQEYVELWESLYGEDLWKARPFWFSKPKACGLSPYERSLWLDLDCEVTGSLQPLFEETAEIALVREWETRGLCSQDPRIMYNSGVILFSQKSPLVQAWQEASGRAHGQFLGDQQLLSHLIHTHRYPVCELDPIWNFRVSEGVRFDAVIYHWTGSGGKEYIRKAGGMLPTLNTWQSLIDRRGI